MRQISPVGRIFAELLEPSSVPELLAEARRMRDAHHGPRVSFSRKVFIPLTRLCRDVCSYCTFATRPKTGHAAYLTPDEVNESISRAAGTQHGQELPPAEMDALITSINRVPMQRTTLYGIPPADRNRASYLAAPLAPVVQTPLRRAGREAARASWVNA
ncbi:MAG TPA: hypothetical protein VGL34_30135 [Steroidobacteraceae bacterium]|jgi:2-iminoacetate synthase ThiH